MAAVSLLPTRMIKARIYTEPTALLSHLLLVVYGPLIDGHFSASVL
jgi:hypothetical protein